MNAASSVSPPGNRGGEVAFDLIVIGGGRAGMPAAIYASRRGARVSIVEAAGQLGGTLLMRTGQMAAAGTQLQTSKGIVDSPQLHYDDVTRISKATANPALLRLARDNEADTIF